MTRLTPEQIASLTGQALADAVAERVMVWTVISHDPARLRWGRKWRPDRDHNDAARVRSRIRELGLTIKYGRHLCTSEIVFDWLDASPSDICRAALQAVEGER